MAAPHWNGTTDDLIDTRDLIEYAAYWREEDEEEDDHDYDEKEVVDAIDELENEVSEWHEGATMIKDSYFKEYAQELAEDIGAIGSDNQWPLYCIDWEWAARELKHDYSCVEFLGEDYWVRN